MGNKIQRLILGQLLRDEINKNIIIKYFQEENFKNL